MLRWALSGESLDLDADVPAEELAERITEKTGVSSRLVCFFLVRGLAWQARAHTYRGVYPYHLVSFLQSSWKLTRMIFAGAYVPVP